MLLGSTSTARRAAPGSNSCKSPSRLRRQCADKKLTPVTLAPGRLRLATRPMPTGSPPVVKTIGIVLVAALAANAEEGLRSRRSRRPVGEPIRPPAPAADRIDSPPSGIRLPHFDPRHNRLPQALAERAQTSAERQAMWCRGTRSPASPAAARARRAATPPRPPSSVMNSRALIIRSPRRRRRAASAAPRGRASGGLMVDDEFELWACITGRSAGLAPLRMRPV